MESNQTESEVSEKIQKIHSSKFLSGHTSENKIVSSNVDLESGKMFIDE
jgi:hypothetical protein